jgi:hypothetical protein
MRWLAASVPLLVLAVTGCRSTARPTPQAMSVVPDAASPAAAAGGSDAGILAVTQPVFSAPIAAARSGHVSVVAGLVVNARVIRVIGVREGRPVWTTDVISGAKWSAGAELGIQRAADGVSVVWRDGQTASGTGTLVLIGADGQVRGPPIEVGVATCTTADGVAWIESRAASAGRPWRVLARAWSDAAPREILTVSPERSPTLVCGSHAVFVLGDGDDDLTVDLFEPNDPAVRRPTLVMRDADFADEEREHEGFTVGDELEIVRVGASGGVSSRTVMVDRPPSAWRRLKHVLSEEDDLVVVDGPAQRTFVVFTRDTDSACPNAEAGGQRVRALDVDRASGIDKLTELAPPDCGTQRGPFWIPGGLPHERDPMVAWVERGGAGGADHAAPISGLAYRIMASEGARSGEVHVSADAVVDGDCDETGCFAAALLREPGADGMSPEAIGLVTYP